MCVCVCLAHHKERTNTKAVRAICDRFNAKRVCVCVCVMKGVGWRPGGLGIPTRVPRSGLVWSGLVWSGRGEAPRNKLGLASSLVHQPAAMLTPPPAPHNPNLTPTWGA